MEHNILRFEAIEVSFSLDCSGAICTFKRHIAVSDPFLRGFLRGLEESVRTSAQTNRHRRKSHVSSKYFTLLQTMNAFFVMIVIIMIKTYRRYRFCT